MQQGFWNVGIRKRMKATLRASAAVAAVALAFTAAPLTGYAVRIEPAAQEGVTSNIFGSAGSESEFYRQISQAITQGQESLTITSTSRSATRRSLSSCAARRCTRRAGTTPRAF